MGQSAGYSDQTQQAQRIEQGWAIKYLHIYDEISDPKNPSIDKGNWVVQQPCPRTAKCKGNASNMLRSPMVRVPIENERIKGDCNRKRKRKQTPSDPDHEHLFAPP